MTCMHTSRHRFLTSAATFAAVGAHARGAGLPATQKATSTKPDGGTLLFSASELACPNSPLPALRRW
jgi:hypothetical protein